MCFLVGAPVFCACCSNLFHFHSMLGSPLLVAFSDSLHLQGPKISGESGASGI